jgi:hypothetical protein
MKVSLVTMAALCFLIIAQGSDQPMWPVYSHSILWTELGHRLPKRRFVGRLLSPVEKRGKPQKLTETNPHDKAREIGVAVGVSTR